MTDNESMDAIEPIAEAVTIGDQTVHIRPLTVGQLPAFSRALIPVIPALEKLFRSADGSGILELTYDDIMALLAESDTVIVAVAVGAGVERAWLDKQTLDSLVALAAAVFQVNAAFFARALAPAAVAAVERAISAAGTPSSPDSSAPVSLAATSSG